MTASLVDKYGIDEKVREERKAFLSLTHTDEKTAGELLRWFAQIAPQMIDDFYQHLQSHPNTAQFLKEPKLFERLKREQLRYFEELVSGEYGQDYFERRLRVGERHQQIGLEPRWYLGAYNLYIQFCFPEFARRLGAEVPPELMALLKVILLDISLTLEAYFAASTEQLQHRNDELERALHMYFETELKAQQYAKLAGHEIRSSLNAIAHACEEVVVDFGDKIPTEALETLKDANDRCWQVMRVVERILSQPEQAGMSTWVSVNELLEEVSGRLNLYSVDKDVELILLDEPIRIWADPVSLREVFANLVSNAVRHLDKPNGRIAVEHRFSGKLHIFCVSDNGPGIPPDLQDRIFQPFFLAPSSKERGGKGLGLYFVRRIIEQHGGTVWIESVTGQGSRFSFSLPVEPLLSLPIDESDDADDSTSR
ncbi:sensor histidine kinase [Symmachiella dynata]|uniref:sensor histidine kinase n=1 Tax=Symmachiella dynata TaxID=2527995 RepID=UPI0030EE3383